MEQSLLRLQLKKQVLSAACVVYYEFVVNLPRTSFPSTFFVPWTVISTMLCLYFVMMKKLINNLKFWGWCKDFCKKGSNNIVNSDTDFIMSPSDNKAVKSPSSVLAFSSYIYITKIPYLWYLEIKNPSSRQFNMVTKIMFSSGFHLITERLFPYSKITFQKYFWYMYAWLSEFLSIMTYWNW